MENIILTEEEIHKIERGLNITLNTIIYDLCEGSERTNIPRAEVVEVVLDADYLECYGGRENKPIFEKFRKLPYAEQTKIAKKVFPLRSYGL